MSDPNKEFELNCKIAELSQLLFKIHNPNPHLISVNSLWERSGSFDFNRSGKRIERTSKVSL